MTEARRRRRGYLDWMRGLAVLIMIEAHVVDSWTAASGRGTRGFYWSLILGGFGAPLFLFLAGVSVVLSAGSKFRRSGDVGPASRAVIRRGLEIFLLAFVFRVQAWVLGWGAPRGLLRVDILNIMGPSIMAAAAIWGAGRTWRARAALLVLATGAMTLLTPIVRASRALSALPDPVEAYLRPVAGLANFTFFPWAGFLFAGALVGLGVDAASSREREARLNLHLLIGGALLAAFAYGTSFLPSPLWRSEFWTSSPSFFFLRVGLMSAAIALAFAWESRPGGAEAWSPMQQLGRTSLFIYWIHVEMVYGLISLPLHKALTFRQSWAALALFAGFMLLCSLAKDRFVGWWKSRPPRPSASEAAGVS
jgi:uncharacterized membrane protein